MDVDRWLAGCGIAGPILFSIGVGVVGAAQSGYSHLSQPISALGGIGRESAVYQVVNFLVLGVLTMAFAYGLRRGISPSRSATLGQICVAALGVGVFLAGVFPCETCTQSGRTPADLAHGVAAAIAFFSFLPAPFLLARATSADSRWRGVPRTLQILGVASVLLLFVFFALSESSFGGLLQRIYVGSVFLVLEVLAFRLHRMAGSRPGPVASGEADHEKS